MFVNRYLVQPQKILALLVVIGHVLTGSFAATYDQQAELTPAEVRAATQETVSETVEPSAVSMIIALDFFNQASKIAAEKVVMCAKELGIQTPPKFCNQYIDNPNVRNVEAIQRAEEDLNNMQQTVSAATDDDKADLQAIFDRMRAAFDAEMANVITYEGKAKALAMYQANVNTKVQMFITSLSAHVAALRTNSEGLRSLLRYQLDLLKAAI